MRTLEQAVERALDDVIEALLVDEDSRRWTRLEMAANRLARLARQIRRQHPDTRRTA